MELPVWLVFLVMLQLTNAQFSIPKVQIEAFSPSGIKVSIKAIPGIQMFAFHGKLNQGFKQLEPGDFTDDIIAPKNGYFVYDNPNLRVAVGDVLNYWVFVQHNELGYRLDNQQSTISELKPRSTNCTTSKTIVYGQAKVCTGSIIFEDYFEGDSINTNKWISEQYIPAAPDYEFVVYKKSGSVTKIGNNTLTIKPELQNESNLQENLLDLGDECTKLLTKRFKCKNRKYLIQNPLVSGRIMSTRAFTYGEVEIKAQLPIGDWIYPQIYLEDENYKKVIIAYARGNRILTGNDNEDIGGSLLFGGLILDDQEPNRSKFLRSYRHDRHVGESFHLYKVRWTPDRLDFFFDGNKFGEIDRNILNSSGFLESSHKVRLVIGIGVGGITDFPNGFQSDYSKPWVNLEREQVKKFYQSKENWLPSWTSGGATLKVQYVKIKSI